MHMLWTSCTGHNQHQSVLQAISDARQEKHIDRSGSCTEGMCPMQRGTRVSGAVAYRCSVSHRSCWSYREESAREDEEPRHSSTETEWNMRSHSKHHSPEHLQLLASAAVSEQTSVNTCSGGVCVCVCVWEAGWRRGNTVCLM